MMSSMNLKFHILHRCGRGILPKHSQFHFLALQQFYPVDLYQEVKIRKYSSLAITKRRTDLNRLKVRCCQQNRFQERSYASDIIQAMSVLGYSCFTTMHCLTGAPWWLSIVLVVIPIRTGIQIFKEIVTRRNDERVANVNIFLKQWTDAYIKESKKHQTKSVNKSDLLNQKDIDHMVKLWRRSLYEKYKCHHLKSLALPWLHLPIWLTLSFSLREMSGQMMFGIEPRTEYYQSSLESEGCLWFPDLVLPDSYSILPVIAGLSILSSIEIGVLRRMSLNQEGTKEPRSARVLMAVSRLWCIIIMTVGASLPSSLTFYWCLSSLSANIVTLTLLNPTVLKKLNIKIPPGTSCTPYQDIYNSMKIRYVNNPVNWYFATSSKLSSMIWKDSNGKKKDEL